jgi:hypothetical protein
VSCARSSWCMLLGYSSGHGKAHAVVAAEIYRKGRWTEIRGPRIHQGLALSCTSSQRCMVVSLFGIGDSQTGQAAWWDGSRWRSISLPAGDSYHGVSCVGPRWCMVIGQRASGYAVPVAAVWNGSGLRSTPLPSDSDLDTYLVGVSCASPRSCLVVGWAEGGPRIPSLGLGGVAYRWDGRHWSLLSVPAAPGDLFLQSVSCPDATHCVVIGSRTIHGTERLVAYQMVRGVWGTIPPVDHPTWRLGDQAGLLSVDCASSESCVAVGPVDLGRLQAALVERWNGRNWIAELGSARQQPPVFTRGRGI